MIFEVPTGGFSSTKLFFAEKPDNEPWNVMALRRARKTDRRVTYWDQKNVLQLCTY